MVGGGGTLDIASRLEVALWVHEEWPDGLPDGQTQGNPQEKDWG